MFAGGGVDSESTFSSERGARLHRSKSALPASSRRFNSNNPFLDPVEAAARVSLIEEEFGWSGSVGGIRGRDDHQIERDVEYERKVSKYFLPSLLFPPKHPNPSLWAAHTLLHCITPSSLPVTPRIFPDKHNSY
jgi:hypothetical protein